MVLSAEGRSNWLVVDAADERAAAARLIADGLTPIEITTGSPSLVERLNQPIRRGGLRLGEQSLFLTQLASLVRSGLPVDRSLDLLREQAPRAAQRDLLARVLNRIRGGGSLASGLEELDSFPRYVIGVVRAAERGGQLGSALTAVAARLAEAASTRRQLISSLTYPAAVLVATFSSLGLVLTVVVPQFEPVFQGEEARLPTLTRVVLALSRGVADYGWGLLLAAVAVPVGLWLFLRSAGGMAFVARHRHRIPGLDLRDQYLAAQFTGILGTLIGNGVNLTGALPLAQGAMGSQRWQRGLADVERQVREGTRFSDALARADLVPSTAVRLIEVGERTGKLAETCRQASAILTEVSRSRIERIVALANPIAIMTLGGMVALLVGGVMLGIFALGDFAG
jgi:type II secretory pathway component PulF